MAALNLFPARVQFVNADGTLTNEAYRALQMVFERIGGALGDSGADVFGQVFGVPSEVTSLRQTDVVQPVNASAIVLSDTLQYLNVPAVVNAEAVQPANFGTDYYGDVLQYLAPDMQFTDVVQPPSKDRDTGAFTTIDIAGNANIGGMLKLSAGTAALPSLYWSTDTTTGFYRIAANNNGYAVSSVKLLDMAPLSFGVFGLLDLSSATSGQVKFPATQVASSDANTLDDYKEGTWTPSLGGTSVIVVNAATYTKIGRQVNFMLDISVTTLGTGSLNTVSGLPLNPSTNGFAGISVISSSAVALYSFIGLLTAGTNGVTVRGMAAAGTVLPNQNVFQSGTTLICSGTYHI